MATSRSSHSRNGGEYWRFELTRSALCTASDFGKISPKKRKKKVSPPVTYATTAFPANAADASSVANAVVKIVATVVAIKIVVRNLVKSCSRIANIDPSPSSIAISRTLRFFGEKMTKQDMGGRAKCDRAEQDTMGE